MAASRAVRALDDVIMSKRPANAMTGVLLVSISCTTIMLLRLALAGESCLWMEGAKVWERWWWRALAGALAMPERAPPSGLNYCHSLRLTLHYGSGHYQSDIRRWADDG